MKPASHRDARDKVLYTVFQRLAYRLLQKYDNRVLAGMQEDIIVQWQEYKDLQGVFDRFTVSFPLERLVGIYKRNLLIGSVLDAIDFDKREVLIERYIAFESMFLDFPKYDRVWCFLHEFDADADVIDLTGHLRIRKMNTYEVQLFRQGEHSYQRSTEASFLIESKKAAQIARLTQSNKEGVMKQNIELADSAPHALDFHFIVTILHVMFPSSVGITKILYNPAPNPVMTLRGEYSVTPEVFPAVFSRLTGKKTTLRRDFVDRFQRFWNLFVETTREAGKKSSKRIGRFLRRYNTALVADDAGDEVVDLIIALEILFRCMRFKAVFLASNMLSLVGVNPDEAMVLFEDAYKARNKIVHGSTFESDANAIIPILVDYLARLIQVAIAFVKEKMELGEWGRKVAFDKERRNEVRGILKKYGLAA